MPNLCRVNALATLKTQLQRAHGAMKRARENAKDLTAELAGTTLGAGTAAALGALDQAKGEVAPNSASQISVHRIGPVPTSVLVGLAGKGVAVAMLGDSMAPIASGIGDGGLFPASYLAGRELWAKHEQSQAGG